MKVNGLVNIDVTSSVSLILNQNLLKLVRQISIKCIKMGLVDFESKLVRHISIKCIKTGRRKYFRKIFLPKKNSHAVESTLCERENVPEAMVILGPEFADVFIRGANNGEALRPHKLGEEGGDARHPVPRHAVGHTRRPQLLLHGEGEEPLSRQLDFVEQVVGDPMVGDLEHPPILACMAHQLHGVPAVQIDDRDGLGIPGGFAAAGERVVVELRRPCMGFGEFFEGVEVHEFLLHRMGREGIGEWP